MMIRLCAPYLLRIRRRLELMIRPRSVTQQGSKVLQRIGKRMSNESPRRESTSSPARHARTALSSKNYVKNELSMRLVCHAPPSVFTILYIRSMYTYVLRTPYSEYIHSSFFRDFHPCRKLVKIRGSPDPFYLPCLLIPLRRHRQKVCGLWYRAPWWIGTKSSLCFVVQSTYVVF